MVVSENRLLGFKFNSTYLLCDFGIGLNSQHHCLLFKKEKKNEKQNEDDNRTSFVGLLNKLIYVVECMTCLNSQ